MRQRRGFVLLFAMLMLTVIVGAVSLLAREAAARSGARQMSVLREDALRSAEAALEQARQSFETGRLQRGGKLKFGLAEVSCAAIDGGVRLEVLQPLKMPHLKRTAPLQRGVRVAWELRQPAPEAAKWARTAWSIRDETISR